MMAVAKLYLLGLMSCLFVVLLFLVSYNRPLL